jgi:hypothetical protein
MDAESIATSGCKIERTGEARRTRELHMAQAMSGRHWSVARVAASVLLLVLALIYAGITTLFVLLVPSSKITILRLGNDIVVLYSDFAYNGIVIFLASCLLSGYAGVAALGGWRGARLVALAAGWATIALGVYGLWLYANMLMIGLPLVPFSIGMRSSPLVSLALCVVGILVLWATRKAIDKGP